METSAPAPPHLDRMAFRAVKVMARSLIGKHGFTYDDLEDIQQDLLLDVLERLPRYDPSRAKARTFIERIVKHRASTLIESRRARCRDFRQVKESLNERIPTEDGPLIERGDMVSTEEYLSRFGRFELSSPEACHIAVDVARVLDALPPDLSDLARRLAVQTVTEVARELGAHRPSLYKQIGLLREAFASAGIRCPQ